MLIMVGNWPSVLLWSYIHWHSLCLVKIIKVPSLCLPFGRSNYTLVPTWPHASLLKKYRNTRLSSSLHMKKVEAVHCRFRLSHLRRGPRLIWKLLPFPVHLEEGFQHLPLSSSPSLSHSPTSLPLLNSAKKLEIPHWIQPAEFRHTVSAFAYSTAPWAAVPLPLGQCQLVHSCPFTEHCPSPSRTWVSVIPHLVHWFLSC